MKLFQSIFGRDETIGRYPESLVDLAIERAVDGTDSRLRLLPSYRKRLRKPVIQAIDHVVALVDAMAAPVIADVRVRADEPRLSAVFVSAADMLELLGRDPSLMAFRATSAGSAADCITALMVTKPVERHIFGVDLAGDQVRREVAQVAVSFTKHRLLDPTASEADTRRLLKRRAFDHLLMLALERIAEVREERGDLTRQRDLLRRKLYALEHGGWSFKAADDDCPSATELEAELNRITAQLSELGVEQSVLDAHLNLVAAQLADSPRQLWVEPSTLWLDPLNIQRPAQEPSARRIELGTLHNARGRWLTFLPLSFAPRDLPQREDLVTAALRYLQ